MKLFLMIVLVCLIEMSFGQAVPKDTGSRIIRKIKIRSADPQLIALLLGENGNQNYQLHPEITHAQRGGGFGSGYGGGNG